MLSLSWRLASSYIKVSSHNYDKRDGFEIDSLSPQWRDACLLAGHSSACLSLISGVSKVQAVANQTFRGAAHLILTPFAHCIGARTSQKSSLYKRASRQLGYLQIPLLAHDFSVLSFWLGVLLSLSFAVGILPTDPIFLAHTKNSHDRPKIIPPQIALPITP